MLKKITGAGILAIDKKTGKILLGRRGLKGDNPNTWCPFGGTYDEKDKHPRQTAIREFLEESGCRIKFKLSKVPIYTQDTPHVKFYTYIGIFDEQFPVNFSNESVDFGWFDLEKMPENLHPGFEEMLNTIFTDLVKARDYCLDLSV